MEVPFERATCRGCLVTGRGMVNAKRFEGVFKDVTSINISLADGLPQLLCYECLTLLQKCARFRSKVIKSHNLLYQYVHERIPFPHEESARPHLSQSRIMYYEIPGTQAEQIEEQTDGDKVIQTIEDNSCALDISRISSAGIKIEPVWSYDEDDIKLEQCDVYVREKLGLATQGSDVEDTITSEITENEQVAVKCERTNCSRDVTDKDELLDSCKITDKGKVMSRHSDVRDEHLERTLNNVHSSSTENVQSYFKCDTCNRCFENKLGIIQHIRVHSGDKPCKGDICTKHISSSENDQIPTDDKYKCDVCMKCFKYKSDLTRHNVIHTGEKPYKCDVCMKYFKQKSHLTQHIRTHTGEKPFKCNVCMKCYTNSSDLVKHNKIHAGEQPYKCDVCKEYFTHRRNLTKHNRIHTGEKPFKCDVCMKSFKKKSVFIIHNRIHTGEKPFKCDDCVKCFTNRKDLIRHNRIHTGEKRFKCKVCMKCFTFSSDLSRHKRIHTGEKPFKCDVCMKCFTNNSYLVKHNKIHTGNQPYKCDVCKGCFTNSRDLTIHYRIHTGEKPFKCNVCMKSFKKNSVLIIHNRIHTGEKPFKCDVCVKCFTDKKDLIRHNRIHTGDKRYKCQVCMACFTFRSALNRHKSRMHTDEKHSNVTYV